MASPIIVSVIHTQSTSPFKTKRMHHMGAHTHTRDTHTHTHTKTNKLSFRKLCGVWGYRQTAVKPTQFTVGPCGREDAPLRQSTNFGLRKNLWTGFVAPTMTDRPHTGPDRRLPTGPDRTRGDAPDGSLRKSDRLVRSGRNKSAEVRNDEPAVRNDGPWSKAIDLTVPDRANEAPAKAAKAPPTNPNPVRSERFLPRSGNSQVQRHGASKANNNSVEEQPSAQGMPGIL